ncbi:MAG: VWA-like domain-containing protein, partial [Planctomycetota bacterium]
VDVSGSMSHRELRDGFSVANQFFNYGIRELDVLWFDTQIHGEPISFRRARSSIEVTGRGGTDFQCLIDFIDDKPQYDGMIVYTDGEAAKPSRPTNRRAKLLWLFSTQAAHEKMHHQLKELGRCVFIKPSPTRRRQH